MSRIVIGLGDPFRRDDAAGLAVAGQVRRVEGHPEPVACLELLDLWDAADDVVIVDAVRSGRPPGSVQVFEPLVRPLEVSEGFESTHGLRLLTAIGLAKELGRLPDRLVVYGIEVGDVKPGVQLSSAVAAAVDRIVAEVDHV